MKRLPPSGYVTAEASRKPGYLAKRIALYRARLKAEAERRAAIEAEAAAKTSPIKRRA
jgi:hypothetical protein